MLIISLSSISLRNRKEFKEDANPAFMPDEWMAVKDKPKRICCRQGW